MVDGSRCKMRAPCLLPELITVKAVHINSSSELYYPTSMIIASESSVNKKLLKGFPFRKNNKLGELKGSKFQSIPPLYVKKNIVPTTQSTDKTHSKVKNNLNDKNDNYVITQMVSSLENMLTPFKIISSGTNSNDLSIINSINSYSKKKWEAVAIETIFSKSISFNGEKNENILISSLLSCPPLLDICLESIRHK
jgi:hypothetical protein